MGQGCAGGVEQFCVDLDAVLRVSQELRLSNMKST